MVIVLTPEVTESEIQAITDQLHEQGYGVHLSRGVERTIIGVIGAHDEQKPLLKEQFEALPYVEKVVLILKPYKLVARPFRPEGTQVQVRNVVIGGEAIVVMAGPCTVESEEQLLATARFVKKAGAHLLRGGAYKPSTSPYSFQGMGEEGLKLLALAREETGLPIITEVLDTRDVELVGKYTDIFQIGTRNMTNFALLKEVGLSGMPVMLKRGWASTIEEWLQAAEYIASKGNYQILLCERGIRTFEPTTRNTFDVNAIPVVKELSHLPIIADPSHGTGRSSLVPAVSKAAIAAGADGLILEVHPQPEKALKDGFQSLRFEAFERLMHELVPLAEAIGRQLPVGWRAK